MKEIKLTQGYVALVDDEDFERVNQFKWYAYVKHLYRKSGSVYAQRRVQKSTQQMHRFIIGVTDSKVKVDHEDRNGLNNQRFNLRAPTDGQNGHNSKVYETNKSGFKGVSWHKLHKKWQARISVNDRGIHLGLFTDPLEAACAYDMAAVKYFGEFAHCNFAIPN